MRNKIKCCILTFDPAKNAIQSNAQEGSDTFQWQLWEEIAQVSSADNIGQGEGPTSEWCTPYKTYNNTRPGYSNTICDWKKSVFR